MVQLKARDEPRLTCIDVRSRERGGAATPNCAIYQRPSGPADPGALRGVNSPQSVLPASGSGRGLDHRHAAVQSLARPASHAAPTTIQMTRSTRPNGIEAEASLRDKHARLLGVLLDCGSVALEYTGDPASVYLAKVALDALGPQNTIAFVGMAGRQAANTRKKALAEARRFGIPVRELGPPPATAEPSGVAGSAEPGDDLRERWTRLSLAAASNRLRSIACAWTTDDGSADPSSLEQAHDFGIRLPLLEAGLSRAEVLELAERTGLRSRHRGSSS
jgi:hypothetical protein